MRQYIEITQDGIGRITPHTPHDMAGIYTDGLETCLAIILVSKDIISLIHATKKLSAESIKKEALLHKGKVKFWTIGYNPTYYPDRLEGAELQEQLYRLGLPLSAVLGKSSVGLPEAESGFLSMDREGNIATTKKPETIISLPNKAKRDSINFLNNIFSKYTEEFLPGDIQYDGIKYSDCSSVLLSYAQMTDMAIQHREPLDKIYNDPLQIMKILQKHIKQYAQEEEEALKKLSDIIDAENFSKFNPSLFAIDLKQLAENSNRGHGWGPVEKNQSNPSLPIEELNRITSHVCQEKWKSTQKREDEFHLKLTDSALAEKIKDYLSAHDIKNIKILGGNKVIIWNINPDLLQDIDPMSLSKEAFSLNLK